MDFIVSYGLRGQEVIDRTIQKIINEHLTSDPWRERVQPLTPAQFITEVVSAETAALLVLDDLQLGKAAGGHPRLMDGRTNYEIGIDIARQVVRESWPFGLNRDLELTGEDAI
jgi:hypothetical protein